MFYVSSLLFRHISDSGAGHRQRARKFFDACGLCVNVCGSDILYYITLYYIILYYIILYYIILYYIILYYIILYYIILYYIILYYIISYIISYHIISYHTVIYHIISNIIPYIIYIISYRILSYHITYHISYILYFVSTIQLTDGHTYFRRGPHICLSCCTLRSRVL